jgi:hypothetical protein
LRRLILALALTTWSFAQEPIAAAVEVEETPVFGISVVLPTGLTGQVYSLKPGTKKLPDFKKLKPVASLYTHSLAIRPRDFKAGFPGMPDFLEWFAIDYTGRFWIETPGEYRFILTSDDGSRLYVDDKRVINNDGLHVPQEVAGNVTLAAGVHLLRVSYFQGLRYHVALLLEVVPPDGRRRVFSTQEFRPPAQDFEP